MKKIRVKFQGEWKTIVAGSLIFKWDDDQFMSLNAKDPEIEDIEVIEVKE